MANGARPIAKVYSAFLKAGMGNESGLRKEEFLEALKGQGIDFSKTSSFRLARFLRGQLAIEELQSPMKRPLQTKAPVRVKPHRRKTALSAAEKKRLELVFKE